MHASCQTSASKGSSWALREGQATMLGLRARGGSSGTTLLVSSGTTLLDLAMLPPPLRLMRTPLRLMRAAPLLLTRPPVCAAPLLST